MADLTTIGAQAKTMTSREIADLAGARHNDVVLTIERLFDKGVLRASRKTREEASGPSGGRPTVVYDLGARDTYLIIAGYSDEIRAKIIDRWLELEEAELTRISAQTEALVHQAHVEAITFMSDKGSEQRGASSEYSIGRALIKLAGKFKTAATLQTSEGLRDVLGAAIVRAQHLQHLHETQDVNPANVSVDEMAYAGRQFEVQAALKLAKAKAKGAK